MCGINGIINSNQEQEKLIQIISSMNNKMQDRGPDGQGTFANCNAALGHTRLAIVDVDNRDADQPMQNERYVISFNGEIYNHKDIRKELEKQGAKFKTNCDTEVLLEGFAHLGEGILAWPFETASAMTRLVSSGVFLEHPDIKFITHHCGSMIPHFEQRIKWLMPSRLGFGHRVHKPEEHFRKFYNDTAVYGNTAALMCGYAFFGADHLLYGTDAPLGPKFGLTAETIASIERMCIPDEEKEKIFLQNAVNLLKIPV